MMNSVSVCPVPFDQQPLNEYEELKTSWFFRTSTLELHQYISKLLWIWGSSWFVAGPVAYASFAPYKHTTQFFICGAAGASLGVFLVVLRLYLGWSYIYTRLSSPTIFYEESGWYDGQTWEKPVEVLARDRLIVSYQIQPILQRLQRTFAVLALLLSVVGLIWNFL